MFGTTLKAGRKILLSRNEKIINQEGVWRMRIPPKRLLKSLYERINLRTTERTVIRHNMGLHFSTHVEERLIKIGQHNRNFDQRQTTYTLMS